MKVHQIERNPTLQVSLYPINRDLLPDIQDSTKGDIGLRNSLINPFVLLYAFPEIRFGFLLAHPRIIWIPRPSFESYIDGDDCWIVAERFKEEELEG